MKYQARLAALGALLSLLTVGCGDDGGGTPPRDDCDGGVCPADAGMCDLGYADEGAGCADIDECTEGTHDCSASETCVNSAGSFSCDDTDECDLGTDDCDASTSTCRNTDPGWACDDIDECMAGTDDCDASTSTCRNTDPGWACDDIDECMAGTDDCDDLTTCTNADPGFSCSACPAPYFDRHGDGTDCLPHVADISYISETGSFPSGHSCQTFSCPVGSRALAGGYNPPLSGTFSATAALPLANGDFQVCGVAGGAGGGAVFVAVEASCGLVNTFIDEAFGPYYSNTTSVAMGASGCVTAECPAGSQAIGGGGDWGVDFRPDIMKPSGSGGFQVCGLATTATTIRATAICAGGSRDDNTLTATGGDRSGGCLTLGCPADHRVVSGGMNWIPSDAATSTNTLWIPDTSNEWLVCSQPQSAVDWSIWNVCLPDLP